MEEKSSTPDAKTIMEWLEYNFPILNNKTEPDKFLLQLELTEESLKSLSINFCLQSLVLPQIEQYMRQLIAPKFWSKFINVDENDEKQGFQNFTMSVNELYTDSSKLLPQLKKLQLVGRCTKRAYCQYGQQDILEYFKLMIRATLLSQLPVRPTIIIEHFYRTAFSVFCNIEATSVVDDSLTNGLALCEGCRHEQGSCQCQAIVDVFHETNKKLLELGLLERLVGSTLTSLIHARIEAHVHQVCTKGFDASQLQSLETWLETVVLNWLVRIYSGGSARTATLEPRLRAAVTTFKRKLDYFLCETYTRLRIEQLFNIIIEYPESRSAVDDLRICLERTNLRKYLVRSLQQALRTRLLHPGVGTPDILTAYVAAIKTLRHLEPQGVLLETVSEPVRAYLRGREDTVRCVVSGLLDESAVSDLADELARGGGPVQLDAEGAPSPQEEPDAWMTWMPDPVDAGPEEEVPVSSGRRRAADIISTLVNVYGSQDLFVNEYRNLLADRLLSQLNYRTERELRQLELLKRRFGEQPLHQCEVMIKDVCDSKRIDGNIQVDRGFCESRGDNFAVSALVLSAQFWPPFKEDYRLELPISVQTQLDRYVRAYEALKGNRTLCWKPHLGSVNLDLELTGRTLNFDVSPIHATIVLHFQERAEWGLDHLADLMHVPATVLRRKIGFWVSQGLLLETGRDTFRLQEEPAKAEHVELLEEEEAESAMASATDQREEELQVFWSYIVGMLTNLDSMPLERIHQMLKMFASQGSGAVECGLPELRQFLDKKVREHQLLFSGGLYKLPKS